MNFKIITENEAVLFDDFIKSTPNGHIFQSYLWGEVKKPVWEPLRVVLKDDKGQIVAAASILKRKIPFLRKSVFYLPRGPVMQDWHNVNLFSIFMAHLQKMAQSHRAIFIKIDPCLREGQTVPVETLRDAGFITAPGKHDFGGLQPRYTFRLNIEDDLEEIMNKFSKKMRYKIRYGVKKGLTFVHPGEKGLDMFKKVMQETGERGNFITRNLSYYQKVYRVLSTREAVDLSVGCYQGEPITAGITFAFGDKAWAIYGGQINRYRNLYAYHAMIWERIVWAKNKGAKWFDFYGVPGPVDEEHPLYGIYYFKKSFGGEYFAFIGEKDLVLSPIYYWLWTRLFPAARGVLLRLVKVIRLFRSGRSARGKAVTGQQQS